MTLFRAVTTAYVLTTLVATQKPKHSSLGLLTSEDYKRNKKKQSICTTYQYLNCGLLNQSGLVGVTNWV